MKVAIVGSRTATEDQYELLCQYIPIGASQIFSGGAQGADALAERYARECHLTFRAFLPDYERYGRRAPLRRNEEMVEQADYVIALWDGVSRGTAHAICAAIRSYTPVRVVHFDLPQTADAPELSAAK